MARLLWVLQDTKCLSKSGRMDQAKVKSSDMEVMATKQTEVSRDEETGSECEGSSGNGDE